MEEGLACPCHVPLSSSWSRCRLGAGLGGGLGEGRKALPAVATCRFRPAGRCVEKGSKGLGKRLETGLGEGLEEGLETGWEEREGPRLHVPGAAFVQLVNVFSPAAEWRRLGAAPEKKPYGAAVAHFCRAHARGHADRRERACAKTRDPSSSADKREAERAKTAFCWHNVAKTAFRSKPPFGQNRLSANTVFRWRLRPQARTHARRAAAAREGEKGARSSAASSQTRASGREAAHGETALPRRQSEALKLRAHRRGRRRRARSPRRAQWTRTTARAAARGRRARASP